MCLTGTPISNTPLDLYALFEFLSEGGSGFQSWKAFKDFYGVFDQTGDGYAKLVGIQNLPFMKERLTRTAFIVTKKEALPWLPDKVFDVMEAEMSTAQQDAYDSLARELAYSVEDQLDRSGNKAITIQNVLTQLLRLAQITCGFIKWDAVIDEATGEVLREARLEYFPECPKLETLVECLREKGPDEKTIVWSCFVPTIRQVSERLTAEGIRHVTYWGETTEEAREEAERQFNCEPECRVFLGNQGAGGTGLNLLGYPPHEGDGVTTDCNHHIYYAVDWSFIKRDQSGSRNHRRGTRVQVRETDLVVPESIDEDIRVRVGEKKLLAMEVSDVREILGTILAGLLVKKRERD
jgi:SNF2 family DNA or RNA helicase